MEGILWKIIFLLFRRGFGFGTVIQQGTIIAVYDHGSEFENNESYGKSDPPVYNLSRIPNELPMFLSYGGQDLLSDVNGVQMLVDALKDHEAELVVQ